MASASGWFRILHCYLKVQGVPAFTESAIDASVSSPGFNNLERPNVQIVRYRLLRAQHHISGAHYSERAVIKPYGRRKRREGGRTALSAAMSECSAMLPVVCRLRRAVLQTYQARITLLFHQTIGKPCLLRVVPHFESAYKESSQ